MTDHKYAGEWCPTCTYLGGLDAGRLFVQTSIITFRDETVMYECDQEDHYFDEVTLDMLAFLKDLWTPAAPPTDQPAEQARQAKGYSQSRSAHDNQCELRMSNGLGCRCNLRRREREE